MTAMVGGAFLYLLFTLCIVILIATLRMHRSSEMYTATIVNLEVLPWQQYPRKTIKDVRGGPQVYQWIEKVFVPEIYREQATSADSIGHCVKDQLCVYGQGHVRQDSQCASNLVVGFNNCPSHMGSDKACCDACNGASCPNMEIETESATLEDSTSTNNTALSCETEVPSWLRDLRLWVRPAAARRLSARGTDTAAEEAASAHERRQSTSSTDSGPLEFMFCPERLSPVESELHSLTEGAGTPLMMADYNQVLAGRITMKRVKIVDHTSKSTQNAYPRKPATGKTDAWGHSSSKENTASFGAGAGAGAYADGQYVYEQDKGFNKAGGFVDHLDFTQSKDAMLGHFSDLEREKWFDLNQGSLVLEVLLWNANVDTFMYVSFIFEHDFSGVTEVSVDVASLSLRLHDLSWTITYLRFALYLIILGLWVVFVKGDFEDLSGNPQAYFRGPLTVLHLVSLVLIAVAVVQYLQIVVSYGYLHSDLPMSPIQHERRPEFDVITSLARRMSTFMNIVSVSVCLLIVRCISQMSRLTLKAMVFNMSLAEVQDGMVAWGVLFLVSAGGFGVMGHLLFGTQVSGFASYFSSFVTTLQMVVGRANLNELQDGDSKMGFLYWVVFHLNFLIISQILLSVILKKYAQHKEKAEKNSSEDKSPLMMSLRKMWARYGDYSNIFNRCLVPLQTLLGASGGPGRVNNELALHHLDQRPANAKVRKVRYAEIEGQGGDEKDKDKDSDNLVAGDIQLRWDKNFYPDGFLQFYVTEVTGNGPADDAGVKPGWRVLQLWTPETQGFKEAVEFRDPQKFFDEKNGFNKDPRKMLRHHAENKHLPIVLVFESQVIPTKQCAGIAFFVVIFLALALLVSRVGECYSSMKMHRDLLVNAHWLATEPTDVKSINTMTRISDIMDWLDAAVLDGEYACAADLGSECSDKNDEVRPGWFMWHGLDSAPLPMSITGKDPTAVSELATTPPAAEGLSLAFVPYTTPVGGSQATVEAKLRPRVGNSVGVMNNNYVRLTFQFPCFQPNPTKRWRAGSAYIIDRNFREGCADRPCMQGLINHLEDGATLDCHDRRGWKFNAENQLQGPSTGVNYTYAKKGTYRDLGGIAVGLGGTRAEATLLAQVLKRDEIFKSGAASAVFELATYNGDYDTFTYSSAKFSVMATGLLHKEIATVVFPLRFFSMGRAPNSAAQSIVASIFSIVFIVCTMVSTIYLILDIVQFNQIRKALLKSPLQSITEFFFNIWNVVGFVNVVLNIAIIAKALQFMLLDGRLGVRTGLESWTLNYKHVSSVNQDVEDPIRDFQEAADIYQSFIEALALNAVFLILRFAKYFRVLSSLRLVMTTLGTTVSDISHMLSIAVFAFFGFVFIFYTNYSMRFASFANVELRFVTMFMFILGEFNIDSEVSYSLSFCLVIFPCFQVFFVIFLHQSLAALLHVWRAMRKDAEEFSISGALSVLKNTFQLQQGTSKNKNDDDNVKKLDVEFWQKLAILRGVHNLDEKGQIKADMAAGKGEGAEDGEEDADAEEQAGEDQATNLDNEEDLKRFHKAFKKAHMELASQMCRSLPNRPRDQGGGVGDLDDETQAQTPVVVSRERRPGLDTGDADAPGVGIITEDVTDEREKAIKTAMQTRLTNEENTSEEIWLDALITVLEEAGQMKKLQEVFLPPPMIQPRTQTEVGQFNLWKSKMERRLNIFLKWMIEEARGKHLMYLKEVADAKERVLKQQSLVLTDYLETLDTQIDKLNEDLKGLHRKTEAMRVPSSAWIP